MAQRTRTMPVESRIFGESRLEASNSERVERSFLNADGSPCLSIHRRRRTNYRSPSRRRLWRFGYFDALSRRFRLSTIGSFAYPMAPPPLHFEKKVYKIEFSRCRFTGRLPLGARRVPISFCVTDSRRIRSRRPWTPRGNEYSYFIIFQPFCWTVCFHSRVIWERGLLSRIFKIL